MKYFIISGEPSGDLHGSNRIKELKHYDSEADFFAWGGELMERAGAEILKHYKELAFMGFIEVLANIRTIKRNFALCESQIESIKPDVVILIDYPGFNLRMAKFIKGIGIPCVYYISPQVWAWKKSRVKKIKLYVDKMLVILPFEKNFYNENDYDVTYVGHPLLDAIEQFKNKEVNSDFTTSNKEIIALLPGSRKQEIKIKLPLMLSVVDEFKDYQFIVAAAASQPLEFYNEFTQHYPNVKIVKDDTYALLKEAKAALVTSGTATLETALFQVPQVVCYKGNYISYRIAKMIVNIKYISLVNLILDKESVKELIQNDLNNDSIKFELHRILSGTHRNNILNDYQTLTTLLGNAGASNEAAKEIYEFCHSE